MGRMPIGAALDVLAAEAPAAPALREGDRALTRGELASASNRLARELAARGVVQHDLVALALDSGLDLALAGAAVWKLGATPQPLDPRLPDGEVDRIRAVAGTRLLLREIPDAAGHSEAPLPPLAARSWKAPTSSGSTGAPKVVLAAADATVDPAHQPVSFLQRDGVHLVAAPLWHSAPFTYGLRGLMTGQSIVILQRFDPEAWLAAVEEHRATFAMVVPTMMQRIWRLPEQTRTAYDVSSLRTVLHIGAPCAEWLKRAWLGWLGPERVTEVYAGSEAAGLTVIRGDEWLAHPGSVGRPAPGTRLRIVDDAGRPLPVGEIGTVAMLPAGGAGSTYRYLGADPVLLDGWETLGDLGRVDVEGYLYLADRSADVILVGGATVYPAQVEAALDAHPLVRSSVVVGLPDEARGERVHAVVDTAGSPAAQADLIAWAAARVAPAAVPRSVDVVAEPLRADTGKVRRAAVRAAVLARGGGTPPAA